MKILSKEQLIRLHDDVVSSSGGSLGIRDEGLLESAINAPFQTFDGKELYSSLVEKVARLGYGLIKNHPFVDGNKRIGTHAMLVFLDINGVSLEYEDDDIINTILGVASGKIDEDQLVAWLQNHTV